MKTKKKPTVDRLYKVLGKGRRPYHGGSGVWPKVGQWREVEGPLVPCENGLHLCREKDLLSWLGPVIYEAEYEGERVDDADKIVVRRARLTRRLTGWTAKTQRLYACDCAEHVLPIYEKAYPGDNRPRACIETARRYARGKATKKELDAARAAARAAAWAAARAAAWAAAWAAARDAARASAWDAAGAAAWAAAEAAAEASAWDAAWAAEREWQMKRLMEYLYPKKEKP